MFLDLNFDIRLDLTNKKDRSKTRLLFKKPADIFTADRSRYIYYLVDDYLLRYGKIIEIDVAQDFFMMQYNNETFTYSCCQLYGWCYADEYKKINPGDTDYDEEEDPED